MFWTDQHGAARPQHFVFGRDARPPLRGGAGTNAALQSHPCVVSHGFGLVGTVTVASQALGRPQAQYRPAFVRVVFTLALGRACGHATFSRASLGPRHPRLSRVSRPVSY